MTSGVYSCDSDLYDEALKKYGYEAQALHTIQELSEFTVEITKRLEGKGERIDYLHELIDAQLMLNQMIYNELNDPDYWRIRKLGIKRLRLKLEEESP